MNDELFWNKDNIAPCRPCNDVLADEIIENLEAGLEGFRVVREGYIIGKATFGTLTSFYGLRKINQANKVMLLSATAYNLKKLLKFSDKQFRKVAQQSKSFVFSQIDFIRAILSLFKPLKNIAMGMGVK